MTQARLFSLVYRVKVRSVWVFGIAYAAACIAAILFLIDVDEYE